MVRRILIALALVLLVSGAAVGWVWWHAQPRPIGEAYAGIGGMALWDGTGPVRRRVQGLTYGQKLVLLDHYNNLAEVRTAKGAVGWVDQDQLIDPDVWQQLGKLAAKVRSMTVQALGHTSVLSNVRIGPGRSSPRVGQLPRNTAVEILARGVAERGGEGDSDGIAAGRKEDWLLVRAQTQRTGQLAGWVLADFISNDLPGSLGGYVASTGMRPVAWFALRKVQDPTAGPKPYYLVAGTTGPEGQICDFTMLRVYTWSVQEQQYETSFVRNGVCGRLPVHVTFESDRRRSVEFQFQNLDLAGSSLLRYRMVNTRVRPIRPSRPAGRKHGAGPRRGA